MDYLRNLPSLPPLTLAKQTQKHKLSQEHKLTKTITKTNEKKQKKMKMRMAEIF